jgi:hypothetical protein
VAPILILIISMFYRKDEQVCDSLFSFSCSNFKWSPGDSNLVVLRDEWSHSNFRRICRLCMFPDISLTHFVDAYHQGISFYDGGAIAPWKIIFILLGGLAIIVGLCVLLWMPDSPVHAHRLSEEERIAALERVRDDQAGTQNEEIKRDQIVEALTDVRTWLVVLSTMLSTSR